jgi:hypothetical protein
MCQISCRYLNSYNSHQFASTRKVPQIFNFFEMSLHYVAQTGLPLLDCWDSRSESPHLAFQIFLEQGKTPNKKAKTKPKHTFKGDRISGVLELREGLGVCVAQWWALS